MRKVIPLILLLAAAISSCKKNDSSPAPVVPPVVSGGTISITAISPAKPYADDTITITGTGFNPDKTKDTVDFGIGFAAAGGFEPYINGRTTASKAVIISATATQLVIKAVNPDSVALGATSAGLNTILFQGTILNVNNGLNQIRVRSGGKQISKLTPFKEIPWFRVSDPNYPVFPMAPNDSVEITLHGVNSTSACGARITISCGTISGCTFVNGYLTLNGNSPQCNCDEFGTILYGCFGNTFFGKLISHDQYLDVVHCIVPSNFFNTVYPSSAPYYTNARIFIKMKMENADGRTAVTPAICLAYPRHP